MNGNELRIGNLLLHEGEIVAVSSLEKGDFSDETSIYIEGDDNPIDTYVSRYDFSINGDTSYAFEPIELTEELLLKAGFMWDLSGKYLHKGNISIIEGFLVLLNHTAILQVKYVHQLQNLYFALTGEELTFNL